MKLTSNAGHSNKSAGAAHGKRHEHAIALKINKAFIAEAQSRGVSCTDSTSEADNAREVLAGQVRKANASKADIAISHHLNAGGGTGIEVFYNDGSKKGKLLAEKVSNALAEHYKLKNRGAKPDSADRYGSLYWVSQTTMPAILIEWGFIDSDKDMETILADIDGGVEAVLDALGVHKSASKTSKHKTATTTAHKVNKPSTGFRVRITGSRVAVRDGAGTNHKDTGERVKRGEVYTIVAEAHGRGATKWGKLKSGNGWISLDFATRRL